MTKGSLRDILGFIGLTLRLTIIGVYILFTLHFPFYASDFLPFYSSAQILVNDRNSLYELRTQVQQENLNIQRYAKVEYYPLKFLPFVNPPFFLIPYVLLLHFPPPIAYRMMQITLVLLSLGVVVYLSRVVNVPVSMMQIVDVFTFAPVFLAIYFAQSSMVTLFILTTVYVLLRNKRFGMAGMVASVLFYKPQLLVALFLFFLSVRLWKTTKTFILSLFLLTGTWAIFSWHSLVEYFQYMTFYAQNYDMEFRESGYLVSLQGLVFQVAALLHVFNIYAISTLISIVFLMLLVFFWSRYRKQHVFMFSTVPLAILLTAGHVHIHEVTLLLLSYFMWQKQSPKLGRRDILWGWLIFLVAYFRPTGAPFYFIPQFFLLVMLTLQFYYIAKIDAGSRSAGIFRYRALETASVS